MKIIEIFRRQNDVSQRFKFKHSNIIYISHQYICESCSIKKLSKKPRRVNVPVLQSLVLSRRPLTFAGPSQVDSRVRVVAWNSHARRTRTLEHVNDLKGELEEALEEHCAQETRMRHGNLKLEAEVGAKREKYWKNVFFLKKTSKNMPERILKCVQL